MKTSERSAGHPAVARGARVRKLRRTGKRGAPCGVARLRGQGALAHAPRKQSASTVVPRPDRDGAGPAVANVSRPPLGSASGDALGPLSA